MDPHPLRRYFRHGFLPQLIAFEACVRLGSVTRAAEELALAQPTVSGMVRKLSDAVGAPVMCMRDRRVEATAAGAALLALFEEIRAAFLRFESRADALARYDAAQAPATASWPSNSRSARHSRWRRRASRCPLARPKPGETTGAS